MLKRFEEMREKLGDYEYAKRVVVPFLKEHPKFPYNRDDYVLVVSGLFDRGVYDVYRSISNNDYFVGMLEDNDIVTINLPPAIKSKDRWMVKVNAGVNPATRATYVTGLYRLILPREKVEHSHAACNTESKEDTETKSIDSPTGPIKAKEIVEYTKRCIHCGAEISSDSIEQLLFDENECPENPGHKTCFNCIHMLGQSKDGFIRCNATKDLETNRYPVSGCPACKRR